MAINEAINQYMRCYECPKYASCSNIENKVKEAFDQPMLRMSKFYPSDGISGQPYKSKYYDDHRYDIPRPMTLCDLEKALIAYGIGLRYGG